MGVKKISRHKHQHFEVETTAVDHDIANVNILQDSNHGIDILYHLSECTWWGWGKGSSLVFWRWPNNFQQEV